MTLFSYIFNTDLSQVLTFAFYWEEKYHYSCAMCYNILQILQLLNTIRFIAHDLKDALHFMDAAEVGEHKDGNVLQDL